MAQQTRFRISRAGTEIELLSNGARLSRCRVVDRHGTLADIVPGFDQVETYQQYSSTMGAIVGRYANRIANARVSIGNEDYNLSQNNPPHSMHGGQDNFSCRNWYGELYDGGVRFRLDSPNGDQGWPGRVQAQVDYRLGPQGELEIEMQAVPDRATYLNMLFHGYWNLAGHESGTVIDHILQVAADHYLPIAPSGLPDGRILHVTSTAFDFRKPLSIRDGMQRLGRGYGHNLCLRNYVPGRIAAACRLLHPPSGRALTIFCDQPGLQIYTANQWGSYPGKDGVPYQAHTAIALETQRYPNSPNTPTFNPIPIAAGQIYRHIMKIHFHALHAEEYDAFFAAPLV